MHTRIENVLRVTPEVFWRLFFDADFNRELYEKLGFESYEVKQLETLPDGRVRRVLRAEPPLNAPAMIKDRLKGRVFYAEPHPEGTLHVVELDIVVKAFGFGSVVERMIEKNTRDSYKVTTEFVNRYAEERGLRH